MTLDTTFNFFIVYVLAFFRLAGLMLMAPFFGSTRVPRRVKLLFALIATVGMAALVYSFIHAATSGWSGAGTLVPLVVGAALAVAFVLVEARTRSPLLPLRLFGDRNRAAAYANFLLGPAAMMSTFFFLTQFLQDVLGFGALATGLAFLPMAAAIFTMSRLVPNLLPRYGPRPLALTGSLLMITGLVWLTTLTATSGYASAVLGPMVLLGLGAGTGFVPLTPVIMSTVAPRDAGAAGGALQTMQQTGSSLGLAILVAVFGTAARGADPVGHEPFVAGMTAAFTAAIVFTVASALVATTFRRPR
jgi:predicted MFS family arabinose efflux permease